MTHKRHASGRVIIELKQGMVTIQSPFALKAMYRSWWSRRLQKQRAKRAAEKFFGNN